MKINSIESEEYGVEVNATAKNIDVIFTVQLTDNVYRSDLGCWITTETSDGDLDSDDYPDFDIDEIISVAETHSANEFSENYTEEDIDFNCSINSCAVYMRIDNSNGEVELFIKDIGHIGSYQKRYTETNKTFDNKSDAIKYASQFRTNDFQDCSGLYQFMQDIQSPY